MHGYGAGYRATGRKARAAAALLGLVLPAGANAIYSPFRVAGYNGPCLRLVRSDGATLDIGFDASGFVDIAAAVAFRAQGPAGARLFVSIWYDQSGSGNHATQTVAANRPSFVPENAWESLVGVTFDSGPGGSGPSKHLVLPDGVSFNRQNHTVFAVSAPNSTWNTNAWFEQGKDTSIRCVVYSATTAALRMTCDTGSAIDIPKTAQARPQIVGYRFSSTAVTAYHKGGSSSSAARAAGATVGGRLGGSVQGVGFNYRGEHYFFGSWPRALLDAEVTALRTALATAMPAAAPQVFNRTLIIDGDSISEGYGATDLVNNFRILVRNLGAAGLDVYNQAVFGTTANVIYDSRLTRYAGIDRVAGDTAVLFCVGSNDIQAGLSAANTWQDANGKGILPHIRYLKSLGVQLGVGTILNRTTVTNDPNKLAQLNALNTLIRDNAAPEGYFCADYAAIPEMANAANKTVFLDDIHPTSPGYRYMEPVARPVVQQAFAA